MRSQPSKNGGLTTAAAPFVPVTQVSSSNEMMKANIEAKQPT